MPMFNWSKTASSNATADASINWAEGMAPSAVNDSSRAMMARVAEWRDDIAGAIVTGGTLTAYTVSSNQVFDTLAHMANAVIAFTPHTTNGATVTLNVDGLGAKPLRSAPSTELLAGVLIAGTPYVAVYNNSDAAFYLQGFLGNPYNIPIAGGLDYWGTSAPNSAFAFPYGQAISRTTYSALFALLSTTFGSGDGSTTFNLPDKRGRVSAGKDDMGGSAASRLTSAGAVTGTTLGYAGGVQLHPLVAAEIPSITSSGTNSITVASSQANVPYNTTNTGNGQAQTGTNNMPYFSGSVSIASNINSSGSNSISVTSSGTSGTSHNNVQPTIISNYIIRVL